MSEEPASSAAARIGRLRWVVRIYRHPSAALLIVQLAGLLLYPFIEWGGRFATRLGWRGKQKALEQTVHPTAGR